MTDDGPLWAVGLSFEVFLGNYFTKSTFELIQYFLSKKISIKFHLNESDNSVNVRFTSGAYDHFEYRTLPNTKLSEVLDHVWEKKEHIIYKLNPGSIQKPPSEENQGAGLEGG